MIRDVWVDRSRENAFSMHLPQKLHPRLQHPKGVFPARFVAGTTHSAGFLENSPAVPSSRGHVETAKGADAAKSVRFLLGGSRLCSSNSISSSSRIALVLFIYCGRR